MAAGNTGIEVHNPQQPIGPRVDISRFSVLTDDSLRKQG